jgi:hypothetical protein
MKGVTPGSAAGENMATIAEFISGTVNEELKKLLQPAGLIPATLFVLLNLAFIYPAAFAEGIGPATQFHALDTPTRVAVLAIISFGLGYLLLSSSSGVLDLFSGRMLRGSALIRLLCWLEERRFRRLLDRPGAEARLYAARSFDLGRTPVLPTALGNALAATEGAVWRRYGIKMTALWTQFAATAKDDAPAFQTLKQERAARDILVNTAFVLAVFGGEGLVFFTVLGRNVDVLLSLIAIGAAFVAYRVAVVKARAWGDAVETAFDLHRGKLAEALQLLPATTLSEERARWQEATDFFLRRGPAPKDDAIFAASPSPLTCMVSSSASVQSQSSEVDGLEQLDGEIALRWIEYIFLVSPSENVFSDEADLFVLDTRIVVVPVLPSAQDGVEATPEPVRAPGGTDALLWRIVGVGERSVALQYKLPVWTLEAEAGVIVSFGGDGYELASDSDKVVTVRNLGPGGRAPTLDGEELNFDATARVFSGIVSGGQSALLELPPSVGSSG